MDENLARAKLSRPLRRRIASSWRRIFGYQSGTGAAADFFVLLDNKSGRAAVESVRFISGQESLRGVADALPSAKFDPTFPDSAPAKILRRGTLSCAGSDRPASCRFVLMLPADAQAPMRSSSSR